MTDPSLRGTRALNGGAENAGHENAGHELTGHAKAKQLRSGKRLSLNRLSSLLCMFLLQFEDCGRSQQIGLKSPA